jgi:hypothetical protein
VTNDQYRALALSCWSLGTMNGPVLGMPRSPDWPNTNDNFLTNRYETFT